MDFLNTRLLEHERVNTGQQGFLRKKFCAICISDYWNFITNTMKTSESFTAIILDMTKAFNIVPCHRILNNIESCGIVDLILPWFPSQLFARIPVIQVSNEPRALAGGVIQNGLLHPLRLLLYVNHVLDVIRNGVSFLYDCDV